MAKVYDVHWRKLFINLFCPFDVVLRKPLVKREKAVKIGFVDFGLACNAYHLMFKLLIKIYVLLVMLATTNLGLRFTPFMGTKHSMR